MRNPFVKAKPKTETYRLGVASEMAIPPGWNYNQYLASYGQIGWLFGAVSVIANAAAEVNWHLYKVRNGEHTELDNHPALDLINKVNPFQTRYEFFQSLVTYRKLVGDAYIVLNYARTGYPVEMWLASPSYMSVIPHPTQYLSHYEYRKGTEKVRFELNEIIRIKDPNPLNPLAGLGTVQPLSQDLDSERNAARYQNKLFYNDGRPGLIVSSQESYPGKDEAEERVKYWNSQFRGVGNAYKTAFLYGGATANVITLSNKDMDFKELRRYSRDTILGAYHIPQSIMGISEVGSRARAEADEYIFAKRVIKPELTQIKEALNEQLLPLFGDDLEFDFDDPVPENREQEVLETTSLVTAGVITREMALAKLGYDEPTNGTYLLPWNISPVPVNTSVKSLKTKGYSDEQKEVMWRSYSSQTMRDESLFKTVISELFDSQRTEVIDNLTNSRDYLFNESDEAFQQKLIPAVEQSFKTGWGFAESTTRKPIKEIPAILNNLALEWIKNHSLELAKGLNETTKRELQALLAEGYAQGEGIAQLTARIDSYYRQTGRAEMVARTETIAASNEGALQLYQSEGVEKVQWYTSLDGRTCEICMPYHEEVFPVMESHNMIPAHPRCRCVWLAYVD